jgi:hypothetical protein
MPHSFNCFILLACCLLFGAVVEHGQGAYEIQVYAADTLPLKN